MTSVEIGLLYAIIRDWIVNLLCRFGNSEYNILLEEKPEFHIKEEDRKLFIKITEEGGEDFMNDGTEYYMILKPLKDEDEVEEEIEKEKQYNKEHGVLVRETFPFPIGEKE